MATMKKKVAKKTTTKQKSTAKGKASPKASKKVARKNAKKKPITKMKQLSMKGYKETKVDVPKISKDITSKAKPKATTKAKATAKPKAVAKDKTKTTDKETSQRLKMLNQYLPDDEQMTSLDELEIPKPKPSSAEFKVGEKVEKQLFFMGQLSEKNTYKIHSIEDGVIYLEDPGSPGDRETGITYNLKGEEIERFFLPHSLSKIVKK